MTEQTSKNRCPLIIYHANCADGFTAAWLLWCYYEGKCELMPAQYGDKPPADADVAMRKVWIVDFSYDSQTLFRLEGLSYWLLVFDHHKTAHAHLKDIDFCTFDMNKSGARLVWEYLTGLLDWKPDAFDVGGNIAEVPLSKHKAPWLVDYTEDRDLWKWELPDSKAVNAGLLLYERTPDSWSAIARFGAPSLGGDGELVLNYQSGIIASYAEQAHRARIGGHFVPAVNATLLQSEVAGQLAEGNKFAAAYRHDGNEFVFSLRSRGEEGLDVSEIASIYGGGGHRNAAGFRYDPHKDYGRENFILLGDRADGALLQEQEKNPNTALSPSGGKEENND